MKPENSGLNWYIQLCMLNNERSFTHNSIPECIHITLNELIKKSKCVYKIINVFNSKRCCADSKFQNFISYV
jgi:hypothetical protein